MREDNVFGLVFTVSRKVVKYYFVNCIKIPKSKCTEINIVCSLFQLLKKYFPYIFVKYSNILIQETKYFFKYCI